MKIDGTTENKRICEDFFMLLSVPPTKAYEIWKWLEKDLNVLALISYLISHDNHTQNTRLLKFYKITFKLHTHTHTHIY